MKQILLIGDSIRHGADTSPGYGIYVKEKLAGCADVDAPRENCRFAQYTLRYFHEWFQQFGSKPYDVIHWNNGLWDALRLFGDEPFTPISQYTETLIRIYRRMRLFCPEARIIFAASTSVKEDWSHPTFTRKNEEIRAYNDAAKEALVPLGVEWNDLYTVSAAFPDAYRSDWVHYGTVGSALLADAVIRSIGI